MSRIFFKKAQQPASLFATAALLCALISIVVLCVAGPAYVFNLWGTGDNLSNEIKMRQLAIIIAASVAAIGGLSTIIAGLHSLTSPRVRFSWRGGYGGVICALICTASGYLAYVFLSTPHIHDISTRPNNPPAFVTLAEPVYTEDRRGGRFDEGYDIARARVQPDLSASEIRDKSLQQAHRIVEATLQRMGWEIMASDISTGHLEAYVYMPWFGFRDQIAIDLVPSDSDVLVHARSVSTFASHDFGVNAKRLRALNAELAADS